jgi:hypothetical protein
VAAPQPARTADEEDAPVRETVSALRATRSPAYLAPGPHTARSERTPVTPAGSRRPPHSDRTPRTAGSAARPLTGG